MLEFVTLRSEFCDTYFCVCNTHFRDLRGRGRQGHENMWDEGTGGVTGEREYFPLNPEDY